MLKYVIGILVAVLLLKRSSTEDSTTNALAAPPEGHISSWANEGSKTVGLVDGKNFYRNSFGTPTTGPVTRPVAPIRVAPSIENFSTRGFYNNSRYAIPGRN